MSPAERWRGLSPQAKFWAGFIASLLTIFSAGLTAAATAPVVWRTLGLPAIATEAHVEARLAPLRADVTALRGDIIDTATETAELRRSQIESELFRWQTEVTRAADPSLRGMINGRISDLTAEKTTVARKIEQLQRARYGAH